MTLAACSNGTDATPGGTGDRPFPMTLDSCGRPVTIEKPPERVLTTGTVAAPLIAAAGAADKIVARTFETASFPGEYADELAGVPVLSRTEALSREAIIAQQPDIVVSYEGSDNAPEELEAAGIDVYVTKGYCLDTARGTFEEIFADIELLGRVLGTQDAGTREVRQLRARVDGARSRIQATAQNRTAAALIFNRDEPTIGAYGSRSTVNQQMQILGLRNVFGDVDKRFFDPSIEEVISHDPDVIILVTQADQTPDGVRSALLDRPELSNVTAVRQNRIVVLPSAFTLPSPIAVQGLEVLAGEVAPPG